MSLNLNFYFNYKKKGVEKMDVKFCEACGHEMHITAKACPKCGAPVKSNDCNVIGVKNKLVAGLLAIFLGGFGIHKFYLGRIGIGIVYLIFTWALIPWIIGFIEGIVYLCMSEEKFNRKVEYGTI
jgi:TM2 domain-containing membrane protein YozV/predicted RNA-binding Zn-ribbon protein involved in translation (DUF1610 family)